MICVNLIIAFDSNWCTEHYIKNSVKISVTGFYVKGVILFFCKGLDLKKTVNPVTYIIFDIFSLKYLPLKIILQKIKLYETLGNHFVILIIVQSYHKLP